MHSDTTRGSRLSLSEPGPSAGAAAALRALGLLRGTFLGVQRPPVGARVLRAAGVVTVSSLFQWTDSYSLQMFIVAKHTERKASHPNRF